MQESMADTFILQPFPHSSLLWQEIIFFTIIGGTKGIEGRVLLLMTACQALHRPVSVPHNLLRQKEMWGMTWWNTDPEWRPDRSAAYVLLWRFSTAWYGSLSGGFPLGTVPGTPRPRFQAIRTVTKTWRVISTDHWLAGEHPHYCITEQYVFCLYFYLCICVLLQLKTIWWNKCTSRLY